MYIGGADQFLHWTMHTYRYTDNTNNLIYKKIASKYLADKMHATKGRSYVYMNFKVEDGNNNRPQRVEFELFDDLCPKTCENFRALCEGISKPELKTKIGYAGSEVSRVSKGMFIQAGDLRGDNGKF